MSGYGIVNVTLIAKKFLKGYEGLELRGSVYNLFNKDYDTYSENFRDQFGASTLSYYSGAGRSIFFSVGYQF